MSVSVQSESRAGEGGEDLGGMRCVPEEEHFGVVKRESNEWQDNCAHESIAKRSSHLRYLVEQRA